MERESKMGGGGRTCPAAAVLACATRSPCPPRGEGGEEAEEVAGAEVEEDEEVEEKEQRGMLLMLLLLMTMMAMTLLLIATSTRVRRKFQRPPSQPSPPLAGRHAHRKRATCIHSL